MTTKEIYLKTKEIIPRISIMTVYRNIDYLLKKGEIIEIKNHHNESYYCGNIRSHCHLQCIKCNVVIDYYDMLEFDELTSRLNPFKAVKRGLIIKGFCEDCRNNIEG